MGQDRSERDRRRHERSRSRRERSRSHGRRRQQSVPERRYDAPSGLLDGPREKGRYARSVSPNSPSAQPMKKETKESKDKKEKKEKKDKKEKKGKKDKKDKEAGSESDISVPRSRPGQQAMGPAAPSRGGARASSVQAPPDMVPPPGLPPGSDFGPARPPAGGNDFGPAPPGRGRDKEAALMPRSRSRDDEQRGRNDAANPLLREDETSKGKGKGKDGNMEDPIQKEEANFEPSGLLAMEDNAKNGIPLKFTMPPEARMPNMRWRLYIFNKQEKEPKILHLHRQSAYLLGKDRRVVDVPTDHQTCSKQHAVIQFRQAKGQVLPYLLDLESLNKTFLNGKPIEPARYHELRENDVMKFGCSTREYVLLNKGSADHMDIDPSLLNVDSD